MKLTKYRAVHFLLFSFAILLAGCHSEDVPEKIIPNAKVDIPISRSEKEIVNAQNEFSIKFFNEYAKTDGKNFCISPLSLSMAMSMLANGAAGDTQTEILDALGFKASDIDAVNTFNKRLAVDLAAVDNTTKLSLANSIWIDNSFDVNRSFIDKNKDVYDAEIFHEHLTTTGTMNKINKWCSDKTNGMIPNFLDEPLQQAVMALFNALYFKGVWRTPFDKDTSKKESFYNSDGTTTKVTMMHGEINCLYSQDAKGTSWLALPYGNGAFQMLIAMPSAVETMSVDSYISSLSAADVENILRSMRSTSMNLAMPKFDIHSKTILNEILTELGIVKLFGSEQDLSGISEYKLPLRVLQEAKIIVDETGTEAAAVTGVIMLGSPGPTPSGKLTIDRPFAFMIRETSTGSILFMGRVNGF